MVIQKRLSALNRSFTFNLLDEKLRNAVFVLDFKYTVDPSVYGKECSSTFNLWVKHSHYLKKQYNG